MPEHKILVLGEHSNGLLGGDKADARHHERGMNIACGVVIAVVIIAMIVATVVYFCVNKQDGGSVGVPGESAKDPLYVADVPVPTTVLAKEQDSLMAGPKPSASAFGQVPVHQAPQVEGPLFPRLSAEEERHPVRHEIQHDPRPATHFPHRRFLPVPRQGRREDVPSADRTGTQIQNPVQPERRFVGIAGKGYPTGIYVNPHIDKSKSVKIKSMS